VGLGESKDNQETVCQAAYENLHIRVAVCLGEDRSTGSAVGRDEEGHFNYATAAAAAKVDWAEVRIFAGLRTSLV
jgi:hypothetical protein